jgi:hypothetical protein
MASLQPGDIVVVTKLDRRTGRCASTLVATSVTRKFLATLVRAVLFLVRVIHAALTAEIPVPQRLVRAVRVVRVKIGTVRKWTFRLAAERSGQRNVRFTALM